jgi:hypothetical protein
VIVKILSINFILFSLALVPLQSLEVKKVLVPEYNYSYWQGFVYQENDEIFIIEPLIANYIEGAKLSIVGYRKNKLVYKNEKFFLQENLLFKEGPSLLDMNGYFSFSEKITKKSTYLFKETNRDIVSKQKIGNYYFSLRAEKKNQFENDVIITLFDISDKKITEESVGELLIFYKVIKNYLILGIHIQGGSSHSEEISIYNFSKL